MNRSDIHSQFEIDSYFSEKIKVISLFAIIIVLYEHSSILDVSYRNMAIPAITYYCIAGFWGNCAVPIFYAISGFLFYYGATHISIIIRKMKKRIRTLLIPFIIAALYYPSFFIIMELTPLKPFIDRPSFIEFITTQPLTETFNMLFYGSSDGYPWAYHLWFMRDLITIIAICPALFYLRKWLKSLSIIIPITLYLIFPHIRFLDALIWFMLGSFILDKTPKLPKAVICIISTLYITAVLHRIFTGDHPTEIERLTEIALGITAIWGAYDIIVPSNFTLSSHKCFYFACQFIFFIYLYHEPILHIIVKGIILILEKNAIGYTIAILLPPIIITPVGVMIGLKLREHFPKFYHILVGGR